MDSSSQNSRQPAERHIVLVAPDVHWNTGNIGLTCLGAGARLHLVRPLGFSLDDKAVKRAGLDYWPRVKPNLWDSFDALVAAMSIRTEELALFTKNGSCSFRDIQPAHRLFLVFGSETRGLPDAILAAYPRRTFHIPISCEIRSLNLSTAAGIALYESLRHGDIGHAWPPTGA